LLDEGCAVGVNLFGKRDSFLFCLARRLYAADLVVEETVNEDMKRVVAVAEIVRAAASYDHAVSGLRDFPPGVYYHPPASGSINQIRPLGAQGAFEAPAHERFDQAIIRRIARFFPLFHQAPLAIHAEGDLVRQPLVPELPAETVRHLLGNDSPSTSEFPVNRN